MLTPPDIDNHTLITAVREAYGLRAEQVNFLPLGADMNTAVYRLEAAVGSYFLKLRKGDFDEISVAVPRLLHEQGCRAIIAPLETRSGGLWAKLDPFRLILYPFIDGKDGYEVALNAAQWREFGAAMRQVHQTRVPEDLARRIPREMYSPHLREMVRAFQAQAARETFRDPAAAKFAELMNEKRAVIDHMLSRADVLSERLAARALDFVLCHADIHAGNLHITPEGALYIVDWDNPIFAPRERDLLLVGGCATWSDPRQAAWFYAGYGAAPVKQAALVNPAALAYYRYERVIADIAAFGEQLLLTDAGGADRDQALVWFASNFLPGHEIDLAMRVDEGGQSMIK